jgi:hypothetical protein
MWSRVEEGRKDNGPEYRPDAEADVDPLLPISDAGPRALTYIDEFRDTEARPVLRDFPARSPHRSHE